MHPRQTNCDNDFKNEFHIFFEHQNLHALKKYSKYKHLNNKCSSFPKLPWQGKHLTYLLR